MVLLLADHGEAFGEGNLYFDHHGLYDAVTRVAAMLLVPGGRPGRVDALVSTEDLLPTLCDLAGLPRRLRLTGMSLRPLLDGTAQRVRDRVVAGRIVAAGLARRSHRSAGSSSCRSVADAAG